MSFAQLAQTAFGLPISRRRTFASALQATAHSDLPALRHPWLRWSNTPAPGTRGARSLLNRKGEAAETVGAMRKSRRADTRAITQREARRAGCVPADGGRPRQVRQDVETCREDSNSDRPRRWSSVPPASTPGRASLGMRDRLKPVLLDAVEGGGGADEERVVGDGRRGPEDFVGAAERVLGEHLELGAGLQNDRVAAFVDEIDAVAHDER